MFTEVPPVDPGTKVTAKLTRAHDQALKMHQRQYACMPARPRTYLRTRRCIVHTPRTYVRTSHTRHTYSWIVHVCTTVAPGTKATGKLTRVNERAMTSPLVRTYVRTSRTRHTHS
jgi:hypothetical protein